MKSIYQQILGCDFARLHHKIRERFGFSSADHVASVGVGTMQRMWRGPAWTWPFLRVGSARRIMFPDAHDNTPFVIENYAYRDPFGRETVTWIRTFDLPRARRRFDAYMIYSQRRNRVVDYLGTHEHLAVDLDITVSPQAGVRIRSGAQRFYERLLGFPIPAPLTGIADVHEWFDDDIGQFRISVDVRHQRFGKLFGYEGTFDVIWVDAPQVPKELLPLRHEARE